MKISVGIVGYGNLGKAVEKQLQNNDDFKLKAIFSKRKLQNTIPFKNIEKFKDKIDLLFLCSGSQNELENQAIKLIENFNIIECYDNHSRLAKYLPLLNEKAKNYNHIALCSLGWDPGLFSLMRALFSSLGFCPYTFWGKGLSQGHTQAIKNINGVIDGIQFTLPNEKIISKIKKGEKFLPNKNFHSRQCFVVAEKEDQSRITKEIITMKDYFQGYKTSVKFVSQHKLDKLKSFSHKGEVCTENNILNFSLNLPSNPDFTARVLLTYARSFCYLKKEGKTGAFSILDIPIKYITKKSVYHYL